MAVILSKVSERVFQILKGYGYKIYMFDNDGTRVYEPKVATRFFVEPLNIMIMLNNSDNLEFKISVSQNIDIEENQKLFNSLRETAKHYNMDYTLRQFGKTLTPRDFAAINESNAGATMQVGMFGSSKSSYQRIGDAKLIIRHYDRIAEEKRGARSRKIRETFIETNLGERFKLPTNWLLGNRAICNFIAEGGDYNSDTGKKLRTLTEEFTSFKHLFKHIRTMESRNSYINNLYVNVFEKINEIGGLMTGLTKKSLYESSLEKINSVNTQVINEEQVKFRLDEMISNLGIDAEDQKMTKILEQAISSNLDEARPKEFSGEVTPGVQKWASFLEKLYEFTSGGVTDMDRIEDVRKSSFLNQAHRLVNKEVTKFGGAKPTKTQTSFSDDPRLRRAQQEYEYYSSLAQMLNPVDDGIIANIISRIADHFMLLSLDRSTAMNMSHPSFSAALKFADFVGNMIGYPKPVFEAEEVAEETSEFSGPFFNDLTEWFAQYKVDTIINEDRKAQMLKERDELRAKVVKLKEEKDNKSKALAEDQTRFYSLATKIGTEYKNKEKVVKLTKHLNETYKKRLLKVIKESLKPEVVNSLAKTMGVVLTEAKDGSKAERAFRSSEKALSGLEKAGSPRQAAFDKARRLMRSGTSAEHALGAVGLPNSPANRAELSADHRAKPARPDDKYAAMARKAGIPDLKESKILHEEINVFRGKLRNNAMFIEAIEKQRGHSVAEATRNILEQKPMQIVDRSILEIIKEYALTKKEDNLAEAIQAYLDTPAEQINENWVTALAAEYEQDPRMVQAMQRHHISAEDLVNIANMLGQDPTEMSDMEIDQMIRSYQEEIGFGESIAEGTKVTIVREGAYNGKMGTLAETNGEFVTVNVFGVGPATLHRSDIKVAIADCRDQKKR